MVLKMSLTGLVCDLKGVLSFPRVSTTQLVVYATMRARVYDLCLFVRVVCEPARGLR